MTSGAEQTSDGGRWQRVTMTQRKTLDCPFQANKFSFTCSPWSESMCVCVWVRKEVREEY